MRRLRVIPAQAAVLGAANGVLRLLSMADGLGVGRCMLQRKLPPRRVDGVLYGFRLAQLYKILFDQQLGGAP